MKWFSVFLGLLFIAFSAILTSFHGTIEQWALPLHLPNNFIPTLFKALIAICAIEGTRTLLIALYKIKNGKSQRDNFTIGISHLAKICFGLLGVALLLSLFNISLKEALATLSFIAAAIVLMTKDYISNLINGMYLTFTKVINIGDQVQIEKNKGKILDITLTNVHLLNEDDDIIYIPNNKVFSSEIINYTRRELKKSSIEFEMDNRYVQNADQLEQLLKECISAFGPAVLQETINLKVQQIFFDHTVFKLQYILSDPLNKEMDKKVKRTVIRYVLKLTIDGQLLRN
jgi:small-conductance mechanosensitive channel